ncbi:alpha/beta hydrolase [Motilibacter aurantiacus]|uniref:alpha/beta hydrolase n=1 Tax=Motilibacter aurantiacus TaxID=2714955 RepID=UPI00140C1C4E|nr:alpha/beta fold hydrolase [Motilibacter aurantiacus]NHC45620.1 alpha/beta fold hydrolase [Motilibacter aurantiacus]
MPLMPGAEPFAADGGPVGALLCHGFTGTPQSLRPWAQHLAAAGLTVRLPRLAGHGTRWQDLASTRWPDWYATVDRALDELRERCSTVVVCGLSMGGTLALRLAQQRGADVDGLVLVNPSVLSLRRAVRLLPLLQLAVPTVPGIGSDIARPGVVELAYDRTPLRALHSLTRLWALTRQDLDRVTAPLLVMRSAVDHVVEPASTEAVLAGVASKDVEQRVLARSHHVATLDYDADSIFAATVEFADRVSGRRHLFPSEAASA